MIKIKEQKSNIGQIQYKIRVFASKRCFKGHTVGITDQECDWWKYWDKQESRMPCRNIFVADGRILY